MSLNTRLMGHWSYLLPKSAHLPLCLLLLTAVKEGMSPPIPLFLALSIDAAVLRRAMAALRKAWASSPSALSCGSTAVSVILSSSPQTKPPWPHIPLLGESGLCSPSSGHSPGPLYLFLPSIHLLKVAAASTALDVWPPLHSWRGGTVAW